MRLLDPSSPGVLDSAARLGLERVPPAQRLGPKFLRGGLAMVSEARVSEDMVSEDMVSDDRVSEDRVSDAVPGRLGEIPMFLPGGDSSGRDSRAALLAPSTASRYEYRVTLPPKARLRTALGYAILPESVGRTLKFQIELEVAPGEAGPGQAARPVLERSVQVVGKGAWQEEEVDLSPWAGQTVTLRFLVREERPKGGREAGSEPPPIWGGWATPEIVEAGGRQSGYDLLWLSLDTLRADRLGAYGYERRPTSPNLDRFAEDGVVFRSAVSQSPWTRPSHRSMFSGNYPSSNHGFARRPLARLLWHGGWRTAALTGGGQVDSHFGFHDGFGAYRVQYWHEDLDAVDTWYRRNEGRRTFLFLHTFAVHDPYTDHRFARAEGLERGRIGERFGKEEWSRWKRRLDEEEKAYVDALYDGGIAALDEVLGELFRRLEESGRLDRTLVVITSDHGEQLFEHGSWRHGADLYDHQILVPAILRLPPEMRRRLGEVPPEIHQQIQLVDLYSTVLELLGVERQHEVQGRSLVPLLRGEEMEPRMAFSENVNIDPFERKAFRTSGWKLVWQTPKGARSRQPDAAGDEAIHLYDLRSDPREMHDVSMEHQGAVTDYVGRMQRLVSGGTAPEDDVPEDISDELRERLRSLGYID